MKSNDMNRLAQSLPLRVYNLQLQIFYRICPKVPQEDILERKQNRDWENTAGTMQLKTGNNRGSMPDHLHMLV